MAPSLTRLVGQTVTCVWFSDYSVMYLELGALTPGKQLPNGKIGHPRGEFTLYLGTDWRLRKGLSIIAGGNRPGNLKRENAISKKIQGSKVKSVTIAGVMPELQIEFTSGHSIETFELHGPQPVWDVSSNIDSERWCMDVKRGKVCITVSSESST